MATLRRDELIDALTRLGELAAHRGEFIELLLLGGGVMVLVFEARPATRDVDVVIISPASASIVRELTTQVASEREWPSDWLNDAAKGYVIGTSPSRVVLTKPGIRIAIPSIEQLLAMKLCAWRDDVDVSDARILLGELKGAHDTIWRAVAAFVLPGRELKAKYAFDDLWDEQHGPN